MALPAPVISPPTILWTSTAAQNVYIIVNGRTQSQQPITGVQSCTQIDVTTYDTDTYRNELSAAYVGRSWVYRLDYTVGGLNDAEVISGNFGAATSISGDGTSAFSQVEDTLSTKDDVYMGTLPFSTPKIRSMMLFWSGASGTGNVVHQCWVDEETQYSVQPSQQIF